jgi:hypothetical protein
LLEDAQPGGYTILNFATKIIPGPLEYEQTSNFTSVVNTNMDIFVVQPSLDKFGTLFLTVKPNVYGDATVYATLTDSAVPPLSTTKSFVISVGSVNDCPTFNFQGSVGVTESSGVYEKKSWAYNVYPGPMINEASQLMKFVVNTDQPQLF